MFRRHFFYLLVFFFSLSLTSSSSSFCVFAEDLHSEGPKPNPSPTETSKFDEPNRGFDYFLVFLRGVMNGAPIAWGLVEYDGADLVPALAVGVQSGASSGYLQLRHVQLTEFYDMKGFFRLSKTERQNFIYSLLFKIYPVGLAHLTGVQVVSAMVHLQEAYFTRQVPITALRGLMSSVWTLFNTKLTGRLLRKYPDKKHLIWRTSRIAQVLISSVATYGIVMKLHGNPWGTSILYWMGGTGAGAIMALANIDRIRPMASRCANWVAGLRKKDG